MIIMCMPSTYNSQISPIQHIAQPFGTISLNDTLASAHLGKIKHIVCELINAVLQSDVTPVDNVNAIRLWIGDLLLHETSKTRQICGNAWDTHDGTFGRCVTPWFIVRWEYTQMATANELLVVQTEQWICGRQEFRMEYHLHAIMHGVE